MAAARSPFLFAVTLLDSKTTKSGKEVMYGRDAILNAQKIQRGNNIGKETMHGSSRIPFLPLAPFCSFLPFSPLAPFLPLAPAYKTSTLGAQSSRSEGAILISVQLFTALALQSDRDYNR